MTETDARALVERITALPGYTSSVGTRVLIAMPGNVELALDKREDLLQANGYFHGGVIAALADHAAGAAATTSADDGYAVTITLTMSYLLPAAGDTLVARAKTLRSGRISTCEVEVSVLGAGKAERCATGLVTLRTVSRSPQDMPAARATGQDISEPG